MTTRLVKITEKALKTSSGIKPNKLVQLNEKFINYFELKSVRALGKTFSNTDYRVLRS